MVSLHGCHRELGVSGIAGSETPSNTPCIYCLPLQVAAFLAAYLLVCMAAHADNVHSTRASLTAMSGCLVVLPALWHAHGTGSTNMAWWRAERLFSLFVVAYSTPVAIYHNSQLIGVLTCACLHQQP